MRRIILALVATVVSTATLTACNESNASDRANTTEIAAPKADSKVEVVYFHGKQRCMTCMAIEKEAKALMDGELAEMVKSGKVRMRVIDFSTDEGKAIAKKYKVTFSSLFVVANTGKNEKAEDLTRFAFANARSNPEGFRKELKSKVLNAVKQ